MRKIAIFTEGLTEQLFVAEIIRFEATKQNYAIKNEKLYGGKSFPAITMEVDGDVGDPENCDFYFLLLDCASDNRVVSAIAERYDGLVEAGYSDIIAIRDLAPTFKREQLERFIDTARKQLPQDPIDPLLVVAVMETEAWFIAERTHFVRLNIALTDHAIFEATGINVSEDASLIERPSKDLPRIYDIVGLNYNKARDQILQTISVLDLDQYRDDAAFQRALSLKPLFEKINGILGERTLIAAAAS